MSKVSSPYQLLTHYPYQLRYHTPIKTSRGELNVRESWFLYLNQDTSNNHLPFSLIGESGFLPGLTLDNPKDYPQLINELNALIATNTLTSPINYLNTMDKKVKELLKNYPSLIFAIQTLSFFHTNPYLVELAKLNNRNNKDQLSTATFNSTKNTIYNFYQGLVGIPINGLVWMGDSHYQAQQIKYLLANGYTTIKLKIGGLNFSEELELIDLLCKEIKKITDQPSNVNNESKNNQKKFTIRLDANGAFSLDNAIQKLTCLTKVVERYYKLPNIIHSIEQPLPRINYTGLSNKEKLTKYRDYRAIFKASPIKIALDEELIGKNTFQEKIEILEELTPDYIVLKPGIHGGLKNCEEWIHLAEEHCIGWWITSALESNLSLSVIACWTAEQLAKNNQQNNFSTVLTQGLGTGSLYQNNFYSPLSIKQGQLFFNWKELPKLLKDVMTKVTR